MPASAAMAVAWALVMEWLDRRQRGSLPAAGLAGAIAIGMRPQNVLAQFLMLLAGLGRRPARNAWLRGVAIYVLASLAWLVPTLASQASAPEAKGSWLAYPRLVLEQWRWRLDKPEASVLAGGISPRYLANRVWGHAMNACLFLGFGWSTSDAKGLAGLFLLLAGTILHAWRRPPWRDARLRSFWLCQAVWAPAYILTIFVCLPADPRYYVPIAPLLVIVPLMGWASLAGRWRATAWAVPALLVATTAPLAWQGHVELPPPVAMLRDLNAKYPPQERGRVLLMLDASHRHAEWHPSGFALAWAGWVDPEKDPIVKNAIAIYTERKPTRAEWKGWRRTLVKTYSRSPVIHQKHAKVELYRLERMPPQ
jgi:hypothetical protein